MDDDESDGLSAEGGDWQNWQSHSIAVRSSLGMPPDLQGWTTSAKLTNLPNNPRARDVIDVAYFAYRKQLPPSSKTPASPRFVVDASQAVERRPWGPSPKTLTQDGLVYAFGLDRVLDGEDSLAIFSVQRFWGHGVFAFSIGGFSRQGEIMVQIQMSLLSVRLATMSCVQVQPVYRLSPSGDSEYCEDHGPHARCHTTFQIRYRGKRAIDYAAK